MAFVIKTIRITVPQVAVLLETSHGVSRMELQGILKYARVHGPWSIHNTLGGTRDLKVPDLRHWKGDGIIGRVTTGAIARDILASRLPAVLFNPGEPFLNRAHPLSKCSRTRSDNVAIGRLAAEYFMRRGFAQYAYVGEPGGISWSVWRQEAYAARLEEAGHCCLAYPLPPRTRKAWDIERTLLCAWLRRLPKPVAVFAANDRRAQQVLDACLVSDIAVPYAAAVLGVTNDLLICETSIPPLSSIALDTERAGYEAARMLDERMHNPRIPREVFTYGPTGVVTRASTEDLRVSDKLVIRALEFIRVNGGLMIRVPDVADQLGVTCRCLERRFARTVGQSVHETIQHARLTSVCAMLTETDLPLAAISKRCGFTLPNHLCTLFKTRFGLTMREYRKREQARAANHPPLPST